MIYLGSDHFGYELKLELKTYLEEKGEKVIDLGVFAIEEQADYPDIAREVSEKVLEHPEAFGLLVGKSGIGMMMAANKLEGIKAVLAKDVEMAEVARECHNANVLTVGLENFELVKEIVDGFLKSEFVDDETNLRCLTKMENLKESNNG